MEQALESVGQETEIASLLERLVMIILESTGASRGILITEQAGQLQVEADCSVDDECRVLQPLPLVLGDPSLNLAPNTVIHFVANTLQTLLLDNATRESRFKNDPYILARRTRSVLCVPLMHLGALSGILYLENDCTPHVFAADKVVMASLLATQAILALENERLSNQQSVLSAASDVSKTQHVGKLPDSAILLPPYKVQSPRPRGDVITRPHLTETLTAGIRRHALTLISAPTGFGKSTLLSSIPDTYPELSVAWLRLETQDNDPIRFGRGLVASLQTILPNRFRLAIERLESSLNTGIGPGQTLQSVWEALSNDIRSHLPDPFVLVLTQCHHLDTANIPLILGPLLEQHPRNMRLVFSSRQEFPFSLIRLRSQGQVFELTAFDLAFTREETESYLNDVRGLALSPAELDSVHRLSDGWPAMLRLLATAFDGLDTQIERHKFLTELSQPPGLAAQHGTIARYLSEEILNHQEPSLRTFLLQTSILTELTPALCAVVTGREDAGMVLEDLRQRNRFVVRSALEFRGNPPDYVLSGTPPSYRYHDIFGAFLHDQLTKEMPEQMADLHRRAATVETNLARKLDHIRAAGLDELAARTIEDIGDAWLEEGLVSSLQQWIDGLPEAVLAQHPHLSLLRGICSIHTRNLTCARVQLLQAIDGFAAINDDAGQGRALANLATCALLQADFEASHEWIEKALTRPLSQANQVQLLLSWARLGAHRSAWSQAVKDFQAAMALAREGDESFLWRMMCTHHDPVLMLLPGALSAIEALLCRVEGLVSDTDLFWQLALDRQQVACHWLRGRPEQVIEISQRGLRDSKQVAEHWLPSQIDLLCLAAAVHTAEGAYSQAHYVFHRLAERMPDVPLAPTNRLGLPFRQARMHWLQGEVTQLQQATTQLDAVVEELALPAGQVLLQALYGMEALAERRYAAAERHLQEALLRVPQGRAAILWCQPAVLLAHLYQILDAPDQALEVLTPVLAQCWQEGTPGLLLQEGQIIIPLLRLAASQGVYGPFATRVLAILGIDDVIRRLLVPDTGELLSPRELDVLELIAIGDTNRVIAQQLDISQATVKSHVTRVLRKLGVSTRQEAAKRAGELGVV